LRKIFRRRPWKTEKSALPLFAPIPQGILNGPVAKPDGLVCSVLYLNKHCFCEFSGSWLRGNNL